jgi:hypothetical protein
VNPKLVTPILVGALLVWGIYRRARRNIGRQRVQVRRISIRIAIFAVLGAIIAAAVARDIPMLAALLAAAGGALLGYLGLRYTKFEVTSEGRFYTPHAYLGLAVTALFIARLLYRVLMLDHGMLAAPPPGGNPLAIYERSPLTLAMFGAIVGYYVLYYVGVLQRTRESLGPVQESHIDPR